VSGRRLIGAALGMIGLIVGVVALVIDSGILGGVSGLLALAAGLAAHTAETRAAISEARVDEVRSEMEHSRLEIAGLRSSMTEAQERVERSEGTIAELMANQPVPISPGEMAGIHDPADTRMLADPETNLFSEAYFRVALDARIASARRHLRPVAVALLEVVEGPADGPATAADPLKVTGSIRQTLRDADTACRMTDGSFALILEDTPENGAVWTVERVRRNLTSRHGQHTLWAGVACYPAHAFSTDELLDQAQLALEAAREWKQDRIEIATAD